MELKNYLFLWLITFSVIVVLKKTSFVSHFIWPVMKTVKPELREQYESYDHLVRTLGVSDVWWRSALGDLLCCHICLSYWVGVAVFTIGAPAGSDLWMYLVVPLSWIAFTYAVWKE